MSDRFSRIIFITRSGEPLMNFFVSSMNRDTSPLGTLSNRSTFEGSSCLSSGQTILYESESTLNPNSWNWPITSLYFDGMLVET